MTTTENVETDYKVGDLSELDYKEEQFDCIALIFAHFSEEKKDNYLKQIRQLLKRGGVIILKLLVKNK